MNFTFFQSQKILRRILNGSKAGKEIAQLPIYVQTKKDDENAFGVSGTGLFQVNDLRNKLGSTAEIVSWHLA